MPQKLYFMICAIIVGLFSVPLSPHTTLANDAKCNNIKLLNKEWQKWCGSQGWGMDANGRWVKMRGGKQLKTPGDVDNAKKKVPTPKIYWTEGKRVRPDHLGHSPKGGWR
jgi:hypothetical protein